MNQCANDVREKYGKFMDREDKLILNHLSINQLPIIWAFTYESIGFLVVDVCPRE